MKQPALQKCQVLRNWNKDGGTILDSTTLKRQLYAMCNPWLDTGILEKKKGINGIIQTEYLSVRPIH